MIKQRIHLPSLSNLLAQTVCTYREGEESVVTVDAICSPATIPAKLLIFLAFLLNVLVLILNYAKMVGAEIF